MAALLIIVSWAVITHLHHQLNDQEHTTMSNRRPLAHYTRQKLEMRLDHLRTLEAADAGHACTCGQPHIDGQARTDTIARIERELELRDLWEEGR